MRKPPNNGVGYIIDLAEITIPGGVIRIDRTRLAFEYELTLGHFGLPHIGGKRAVINQFEDSGEKGNYCFHPWQECRLTNLPWMG